MTGGEVNIKNSNFYDMLQTAGLISAYASDSIKLDNVTFKNFMGSAINGNSSYICINNDFVAAAIDYNKLFKHTFSDDLVVIPSKYSYSESDAPLNMSITDMVPHFMEWLNSDASFYLTAIHVGGQVVGYYAVKPISSINMQ